MLDDGILGLSHDLKKNRGHNMSYKFPLNNNVMWELCPFILEHIFSSMSVFLAAVEDLRGHTVHSEQIVHLCNTANQMHLRSFSRPNRPNMGITWFQMIHMKWNYLFPVSIQEIIVFVQESWEFKEQNWFQLLILFATTHSFSYKCKLINSLQSQEINKHSHFCTLVAAIALVWND